MKIIRAAKKAEANCIGKQKISQKAEYRSFTYTMHKQTNDGLLIYNNLTNELILLDESEQRAIADKNINSHVFRELIEKWYFVPNENNDVELCNQVNSLMRILFEANSINKSITQYTILTTTDCNARCFYCYEAGRKKIYMSDKTAEDVAEFIKKSSNGESVTFRWFGGEPLYNSAVIDIICSKLKGWGIEYQSSMVTNGYLFDEDTVKKAKENWNLRQVQITLDGTEEVYNRCKAFIYKEDSPYKRVINNIKLLLDADINVKIRMNADEHNLTDLYDLVKILEEKFGGYKNFALYSHLIFEGTGNNRERSDQKKKEIFEKHNDFLQYIISKGLAAKATLHNYLRYQQCMADNPSATVILPDGKLGRCEHFSDNEFSGSIYSEDKDYDVINRFKKMRKLEGKCDTCPVRPSCVRLEMCPDLPKECTDYVQEYYIKNALSRMEYEYVEFKTGKRQTTDLWD